MGGKMESSVIEYIIKPKNKGRRLLFKVLAIAIITVISSSAILIAFNLLPFQFFMPAALVLLCIAVVVGFVVLQILSVEHEISIGRSEISIVNIYGKRWRKPVLDLLASDINEIGIYDDNAYEALSHRPIQKLIYCVSDFDESEIYYALFELDGERAMLCFEADERVIARLRSLNPRACRQGSL